MNTYTVALSEFKYIGQGHYRIIDSDTIHDLFIKKGSEQLIVLGQGAVDKSKPQPNFQRISWVSGFEDTIIISSDPIVNSTDLSLAWFQKGNQGNYFYRFSDLLKKLSLVLNCNTKPPIFYGSSAGGFTSLMLSSYFEGAWAVVNNPQTDWTLFHKNKVEEVLACIYDGVDIDTYKKENPHKYSPLSLYQVNGKVPNIIYLQNSRDVFHYELHYIPFVDALKKIKSKNKLIIYLYDNLEEGHNPASKVDTLPFISMARDFLSS